MPRYTVIKVGKPMNIEDLRKAPTPSGRKPNPRDEELKLLVREVSVVNALFFNTAAFRLPEQFTFGNAGHLREALAMAPQDRILVETDAPYLAPQPYRGKRNEPAWVAVTNNCLAEVHGVDPETMARQTTANAHRLFFHRQA